MVLGMSAFSVSAEVATPANRTTDIPAEGKSLEIIDYKDDMTRVLLYDRNDEKYGAFIGEKAGTTDTTLKTVLSFEKSGLYNVKFHGTAYKNGGWSKINFYMDDVLLVDNDESKGHGTDNSYKLASNWASWFFTKEKVYIEKGEHMLTMDVLLRENPVSCAFAADFIEFVPVEGPMDAAVLDTTAKTVAVEAYYDESVSGTAIVALYSEDKLVGISVNHDFNSAEVYETVVYDGDVAPNTAKVMIWNNFTELIPMVDVKVLSVE